MAPQSSGIGRLVAGIHIGVLHVAILGGALHWFIFGQAPAIH
jgi:hypothetical protein